MQAIPYVLMAASTAVSAQGALSEGDAAEAAAEREAAQLRDQGKAEYAASTRESYEHARQGKIMQENARAAQAASGGTTSDAGALDQLSSLGRDASYNSLSALFEGKSKRRGLIRQAHERRIAGAEAKAASRMKAVSTVLSGGSKMFSHYQSTRTPEPQYAPPPRPRIGNTRHPSQRRY